MGDPDGRELEHGAKLQRETGPARMIPSRRIDEQHVGPRPNSPDRRLEARALPEREQPWLVPGTGLADHRRVRDEEPAPHDDRGRPHPVTGCAGTGLAARKAHDARPDREAAVTWMPRGRGRAGKLALARDQLVGGGRPHETMMPPAR